MGIRIISKLIPKFWNPLYTKLSTHLYTMKNNGNVGASSPAFKFHENKCMEIRRARFKYQSVVEKRVKKESWETYTGMSGTD